MDSFSVSQKWGFWSDVQKDPPSFPLTHPKGALPSFSQHSTSKGLTFFPGEGGQLLGVGMSHLLCLAEPRIFPCVEAVPHGSGQPPGPQQRTSQKLGSTEAQPWEEHQSSSAQNEDRKAGAWPEAQVLAQCQWDYEIPTKGNGSCCIFCVFSKLSQKKYRYVLGSSLRTDAWGQTAVIPPEASLAFVPLLQFYRFGLKNSSIV